ncbi:MAG: cobyrinate a,c-diamide synthase [Deltaproteobacteria bacterium]|nr:cobyrinate a,c-diamide synthase [Deltaproteobacteria bacterium]
MNAQQQRRFPRIILSALRGGSGKTILSIGIIAAWKNRGIEVVPFKKGPDYIDAGWLGLAADRPCYNLDTFLVSESDVQRSFLKHSSQGDISFIEGNRGLYDGIDLEGATCTAELSKLLKTPVILCVDGTKTSRTMAAVVSGCNQFDPDVVIKGVILNRVAGPRHEAILRKSIEHFCGIPVVGAVPKLRGQNFPERHMGLVPTPEHSLATEAITEISEIAEKYLDLETLLQIAKETRDDTLLKSKHEMHQPMGSEDSTTDATTTADRPQIGIIKDSAFQFYYPENLDALREAGAETVFISPLRSRSLPSIDALYIGGGFPETHAEELAGNRSFKSELKALAEDGLPIYAECGGLMYLAKELVLKGSVYPMADLLPLTLDLSPRPQGHGYTIVQVDKRNPYFEVGMELKGHEFHYSRVLKWQGIDDDLVFAMKRGSGVVNQRDGIVYKNVLATYTHLHALGTPVWAKALVRNAVVRKSTKK